MEIIFNLREIEAAAKRLLDLATGYRVFAIHGEMGSGKTTFIHALGKAMGVEGHISSPTFSIINQYKTIGGEMICHLDLYRLKDEEEAVSSGVEDCLFSGNTCFVEWPERASGIFPEDSLHIRMIAMDEHTRKIVVDKL